MEILNIIQIGLLIFLCILTVIKMTVNNMRNKAHNQEFRDLGAILNRYLDYIAHNAENIKRIEKSIEDK